ncbi:terminal ear1 [Spatholobus suberectus]|nr:terminal ear1 [Spatholobus suberectus]
MLSQHPLNPNAEPFYIGPKQLSLLPCPTCYYVFPYTFGFCPPIIHTPSDNPTHENVKADSVRKSVWAKGHWRCHRKFYKTERGVKGRKPQENSKTFRSGVIPFPNTVEEAEITSTTTVMIRNIPNQFKFDDLLLILDEHCLQQNKDADDPANWSKFDFVYLPMDYRKHAIEKSMSNLGYAFVNFTTPSAAFKFYHEFQGLEWDVAQNKKICEINLAQYQGKDTLVRIFQGKIFRCESRDFLPMVFSGGRDGLNRRIEGTYVGNHVWGLPRRTIGTCAFYQNQ